MELAPLIADNTCLTHSEFTPSHTLYLNYTEVLCQSFLTKDKKKNILPLRQLQNKPICWWSPESENHARAIYRRV
jgi:hypothetical protein